MKTALRPTSRAGLMSLCVLFLTIHPLDLTMRFFFSSRRRHTTWICDWSSDVCSSDLLRSLARQAELRVKVELDPRGELTLDSVVPLWRGADWLEREVYDMFGITFRGHPDLRRILMW